MNSWSQIIDRYIAEGRTVSGGKGDQTIKTAEQNSLNFSNTLQAAFAKQFGAQTDVLNFLKGKLQPMIDNPTGLSPQALATMRSSAINNTATTYQNALKATQARTAGEGGPTGLPSGVQAQIQGQLGGQQASSEADQLNQIQMQDESLKQQNYWNAVNAENGIAAETNPLGYASDATTANSDVGALGAAFKQSQQSQLLGALGGLAGGVGTAVGGYFQGK